MPPNVEDPVGGRDEPFGPWTRPEVPKCPLYRVCLQADLDPDSPEDFRTLVAVMKLMVKIHSRASSREASRAKLVMTMWGAVITATVALLGETVPQAWNSLVAKLWPGH